MNHLEHHFNKNPRNEYDRENNYHQSLPQPPHLTLNQRYSAHLKKQQRNKKQKQKQRKRQREKNTDTIQINPQYCFY